MLNFQFEGGRKMLADNKSRLTVSLTNRQIENLSKMANETGMTKSSIIALALRQMQGFPV